MSDRLVPSKKTRIKIRTWHRWLGSIIGIQLLFWIVSGIYFAWVPIDTVRGHDRLQRAEHTPLVDLPLVASIQDLAFPEGLVPTQITLKHNHLLGSVYQVNFDDARVHLYRASNGELIPPLDEAAIAVYAQQAYGNEYAITSIELLETQAPIEYRGPLPVYQVKLDDWRGTVLYFNPYHGQILAVRNNYWRIFDFLWMLHILDFGERHDFNNWLLKGVSLASLTIVLSGFALAIFGRVKRRKQ